MTPNRPSSKLLESLAMAKSARLEQRPRGRLQVAVLLACGTLAGCGPNGEGAAASGGLTRIRVAGTDGVNSATPFFVAMHNGYFKDAGLDVTYVTMSGGDAAMAAAINARQIDVGIGSATQWLSDMAKGVVVGRIIGEFTANNYAILATKGIGDPRALKGKIFAVSSRNAGDHLYSQAVLAHFGVPGDSVPRAGSPP
jgi:NitT/TauT family transport system substrate-binding protein